MFLNDPPSSADGDRMQRDEQASDGYVMNATRLWCWRPDVAQGFMALRSELMNGSTLSPRERAVIVCATVSAMRDSYCSLAWGNRLADAADAPLAAALLAGETPSAMTSREAALTRWARCVVRDANGTTAPDVEALRKAGISEREIFEATALIAFRIAFSTVNDALGARPDWQLAAQVPAEVREAVTFGRPVSAHGD